jgi:hypothetical protein
MYKIFYTSINFYRYKMSQFVDYRGKHYVYHHDNKEYIIAPGMLNSLFKTHGYYADPATRSGDSLTKESIENLKKLAIVNNDYSLLGTINSLEHSKAPSPRMRHDEIMTETTLNEKNRFDNLTGDNRIHVLAILKIILSIGLYLGGWKGDEEPYITSLRNISDPIRVELKITPLIESLYVNPNYPLVKNFPIIRYYKGVTHILKPSVIDNSLNVDRCLDGISFGLSENSHQMASYLISTSYYYTTVVCNNPIPMIEPLIASLTTGDIF